MERILCNKCKVHTNHQSLFSYKQEYSQENTPDMQIDFAEGVWTLLQCAGCQTITCVEKWMTSEDDPEMGHSVTYYPSRIKDRIEAKTFFSVPRKPRRIYREIVESFNIEIFTLSAAGIRAVIEGVCSDKGILDGPIEVTKQDGTKAMERKQNLAGKIEGLHEKGFLTKQHAQILHEHRFLGNEAVHELEQPSRDELKLAIEIIEHTLENIYELSDKAEELRMRKKGRETQKGTA